MPLDEDAALVQPARTDLAVDRVGPGLPLLACSGSSQCAAAVSLSYGGLLETTIPAYAATTTDRVSP